MSFTSKQQILFYNNIVFSLFQGKLQVEERGAQGFSQPHNFVPHLFVPPSNCDHCYQMIIGILNRGEQVYQINSLSLHCVTED